MKKKLQTVLLLLAAAGILFLLYRYYFPNEEKRIRQTLVKLAQAATVPENPTMIGTLTAGDRLRDFFTAGVEINVEAPGEGRFISTGRPALLEAALAARRIHPGLKVEFLDINVTVHPGADTAAAELTARVTLQGEKDFVVQELKLALQLEDRQWRIAKVETVRTLKL